MDKCADLRLFEIYESCEFYKEYCEVNSDQSMFLYVWKYQFQIKWKRFCSKYFIPNC